MFDDDFLLNWLGDIITFKPPFNLIFVPRREILHFQTVKCQNDIAIFLIDQIQLRCFLGCVLIQATLTT